MERKDCEECGKIPIEKIGIKHITPGDEHMEYRYLCNKCLIDFRKTMVSM